MVRPISQRNYKKEVVPKELIRDVIDGREFYYRGYRDVMNKTKTIEEIMASSTLQALIISYLNRLLIKGLDEENYHIFASELGLHIARKVNYGLDLVVYDVSTLPFEEIDEHYANVAPQLVVEVDVKVDTQDFTEEEFIYLKTNSLLKNGADKVIWVTSKNGQVLLAEKGKKWTTQSWFDGFELMNDIRANVGEYLRKKGVRAAK